MSTGPTVSVGIPFYNSEATLLNSVRSVFGQTFQDWELVLMDDGSTDGSLEVARSIDDPRVRVISDGQNLKLPGRLNALHRVTKGKYIARMDSDDLMHPRRLEEQVALLDQRPEVDVVGTLMYAMDARKGVHGVEGSAAPIEPPQTLARPAFMHATIMGRAEWFRNNPYDETYLHGFEDRDLWCRTCGSSGFAVIPKPLYLVDESGITVRKFLRARNYQRRMVRMHGPQLVGRAGTLKHIARTYVWGAAFAVFGALGMQDVLIRMKSQPVTPAQRADAEAALAQIMATEVPIKR
ncbi:MAG: glycosyltransferase family A protein [Armatimonadia bacterium]